MNDAVQSLGDFRIVDPGEIQQLLRSVMDRNIPVALSGSDGAMLSALLWSVDAQGRRIGFSADVLSPELHRLVESEEAVAVCYLDQVKLQFDVQHRMLVHGLKSSVLQASLPQSLFRFQRRQSFRVRSLEGSAPMAVFVHPALHDMTLELRVLDISAGGCALYLPNDVPAVEPGLTLHGVRIELDPGTAFVTRLRIHHVTSIHPQARGARLGCEFVDLPPDAQRLLQRYIDQTQKRRRMLALD